MPSKQRVGNLNLEKGVSFKAYINKKVFEKIM